MTVSSERRLLSAFLLLCLMTIIASGLIERRLTTLLVGRVESELLRQAQLGALTVERMGGAADPQEVALAMGEAVNARVTIIRADGVVTGDSEVSRAGLARMDNHASRPEVAAALAGDSRRAAPTASAQAAQRYSETLALDMLYAAARRPGSESSVLRIARPLDVVYAQVRSLRLLLFAAGSAGLILAGSLTLVASQQARRELVGLLARLPGRRSATPHVPSHRGMSLEALSASFEEILSALVTERDRFETVINGMRGGVLALDASGTVTVANPYSRRLFGLERPPEGLLLAEVLPMPEVLAIARQALAGEEGATDLSLPARPAASGHHHPFRLLITATPQAAGGCLLLAYDVTELRELEELRREFVANVSHELRTPVTAVLSSAEALEAGGLEEPEVAAEFVAAIRRNAERLGVLIADLLQLSRIDGGHLALRSEPVGLAPVAWRVREALWSLADKRAQRLEMHVPMDLQVRGDDAALERVLLNLVENACKYTPEGGRVSLEASVEGDRVLLEVSDDGPGIPESHRTRVFERFYRIDHGRSRSLGGTGLGLAIVKELVEAMDGDIELLSGEPHGAVFRVFLPTV